MAKKETLVKNVTHEAEASYGGLSVAFYDNPRTYTPKGAKKSVTENRLYISIDLIGKKDHIKRKAKEGEERRYPKAYDLYLAAKKAGGQLDETTKLIDSLADKNDAIKAKEKEVAEKDSEIEEQRKMIVKLQEAAKKTKKEE